MEFKGKQFLSREKVNPDRLKNWAGYVTARNTISSVKRREQGVTLLTTPSTRTHRLSWGNPQHRTVPDGVTPGSSRW